MGGSGGYVHYCLSSAIETAIMKLSQIPYTKVQKNLEQVGCTIFKILSK